MRTRAGSAVPDLGDAAQPGDDSSPGAGRQPGAGRPAPGDVVDVVAGDVAHGGWCVARLPGDGGGRVVFVRHALPGERVRARITEVTSRFARAEATEILEPSAGRVEPPCPYARPGGCGGCDWQHASLPLQRELKAAVVRQQLRRIAGIDRAVTVEALPGDGDSPEGADGPGGGASPGLGWRTRVTFAVSGDGVAGLRRHRSHEIAEVTDCLIAHPAIRELNIPGLRWPGARSVEAVAGTDPGERAVLVAGDPRSVPADGIAAESVLTVPGRGRPGSRPSVLRGRSHLRQHAAGRWWRLSAGGFWQVHPAAADTLAEAVLGALRPGPGDSVLDLYCGAGLFAGVLGAAVGPDGTVTAVEADPAAARDARRNLRDMPWVRVIHGDAARVTARRLPPARLTVLDPPRAGAARAVIGYLAAQATPRPGAAPGTAGVKGAGGTEGNGAGSTEGNGAGSTEGNGAGSTDGNDAAGADGNGAAGADGNGAGSADGADGNGADGGGERRIAYVSCDPAILARDIATFLAAGWRLAGLRAFDAFPMTHHVECVATLVSG